MKQRKQLPSWQNQNGKKIVKTKIEEKENEIYKNECEKLKKLKCLNQYKAKIKCKRYIKSKQGYYLN